MGYLPCPVCERESLANVSDLQLRVASALTRPLPCPICSASVSGLQAFHHHLAAHLPPQHVYSDGGTPTPSLATPTYPPTSSPESIPTLERLEITDGRSSPRSPASLARTLPDESSTDRMTGFATASSGREQQQPQQLSPSQASDLTPSQAHNCDLCGLVFSSEHFLKIHKDIIHTRGNFFDVTCKLCKKKFKDFEAYRNHVREDHSDRRYMCDQCPKTFKMKGSLLVHTRMFHDPASPGTCHVCRKTFTTKARKELHEKRYHSTERPPSGKTSPPSPSTKQQKTKNSSLGDAKNWLETLMNENKTALEGCSGQREPPSQQQQQQQQLSQSIQPESPPNYPPSQTVKQKTDQSTAAEYQPEHQFMNHHQSQRQNAGQLLSKEHLQQQPAHTQHSPFEAQQLSKLHNKEPQDQNNWGQDVQSYMNSQGRAPLQPSRPPSEMTFPPYKSNVVFPCQMLQHQNVGVGRPRLVEYGEFKEEKKVGVSPHASVAEAASGGRGIHSQGSPVAVVSPQPHKAETPPASTHAHDALHAHAHDAAHAHADARRNSFPLVNFSKLGHPSGDPARFHPNNYINELSLAGPEGGQALGLPGLGEKIQSTLAVSQQLVYQHCHGNIMPSLNQSVALLGTDSKAGLRVPPLLIPTSLYPTEKLKESPESPVQMEVQKEAMTCEVRPIMEGEGSENTQETRPEKHSDQERAQPSAAPQITSNNLARKDNGNGRSDNKQWECEVCRKSFTTKYFLKKHKRLHTGETPYACAECGKTFTFQQSYHKHILYHSDDKPHQCSYCGRAFKEMSTLHNHVRIHTGEKPFVCETCGKAFRQRVSYLVHQRIHTGVMPYTCDVCGRSFRYKVSLRSHKCEPGMTAAASSGGNSSSVRKEGEAGRTDSSRNGSNSSPSLVSPHLPQTTTPATSHLPQTTTPATPPPTVGVVTPNCVGVSGRGSENIGGGSPMLLVGSAMGGSNEADQASLASSPHHQQETNNMGGRMKTPLETIDLSAISCENLSVQQDGKRSPHKNKSSSQGLRSSGGGSQACQDPLSMAFLHALVDPQQGRLQGECRPQMSASQDTTMPFPSLSPGAMDTEMDHDSFLTNLLM